jgi:DNA-directed RNA polymerase
MTGLQDVGDLGARGATCGQVKTVVRHWSRAARYQHAARFTPIEKEQTMSMNDDAELQAIAAYIAAGKAFATASSAADALSLTLTAAAKAVGIPKDTSRRRMFNASNPNLEIKAIPTVDAALAVMQGWADARSALRTAWEALSPEGRALMKDMPPDAGPLPVHR